MVKMYYQKLFQFFGGLRVFDSGPEKTPDICFWSVLKLSYFHKLQQPKLFTRAQNGRKTLLSHVKPLVCAAAATTVSKEIISPK